MENNSRFEIFKYSITSNPVESDDGRVYDMRINNIIHKLIDDINSVKPGVETKIKRLIKEYPEEPAFSNYLALFYQISGNIKLAYEENRKTLERFPEYIYAISILANEMMDKNCLNETEQILGRLLEIGARFPNRRIFHIGEIIAYQRAAFRYILLIKDFSLAENRLEKIIELNDAFPGHPELNPFTYIDDLRFAKIRAGVADPDIPIPKLNNPILYELYCNSLRIDPSILKKILELPQQELINDLVTMLQNAITKFEEWIFVETDHRIHEFPIHVLFLLSEIKNPQTISILFEFLSQENRFLKFWLNDFLTEDFWRILFEVEHGQLNELYDFILKPGIDIFARSVISQTLISIARFKPHRRKEVIEWYGKLLNELNANPLYYSENTNMPISLILADLAEIKAIELEQQMIICHNNYLTDDDPMFRGLENMLDSLHSTVMYDMPGTPYVSIYEAYSDALINWHFYSTLNDYEETMMIREGIDVDELTDDSYEAESGDEFIQTPHRALFQTPNRNDPCPCGSGKKYKKCCLVN